MKVLVDADACPRTVRAIINELRGRFGYDVLSVSSFNHRHDEPGHLTVGDEDQAADIALINLTAPGDVVVTQDWGLAALALGRGAKAISPDGRVFRTATIDLLLEERNALARYRRGGGRTKGPEARTKAVDAKFREAFLGLLGE